MALVRRAVWLEAGTVAWNILEGILCVAAGLAAGSVALVGFGGDSFIETASGAIVGVRLWLELNTARGKPPADQAPIEPAENIELAERRASQAAGSLLLVLAAYLTVDSSRRLLGLGAEPGPSRLGLAVTAVSLMLMPMLGWAKLKTAAALGSRALRADAYQTIACAWLSLTTLTGLMLNSLAGWWWADPAAALVLVPVVVREGLEGLQADEAQ